MHSSVWRLGRVLAFSQTAVDEILQAIPDTLSGVILQTAAKIGIELTPANLCNYLRWTPGPVSLYAYLNMTAN